MKERPDVAFVAGVVTVAVTVSSVWFAIPQRIPSPGDCADLWNRRTNAQAQRDVVGFEKVSIDGWDSKAGPHCGAIFFDRPGAPWQAYVLWVADPDGMPLAYHPDIGGGSFGSPAWYDEVSWRSSPNATIGRSGRLVLN